MRIRIFFLGSGSADYKNSDPDTDPTLIRNEKKYILGR